MRKLTIALLATAALSATAMIRPGANTGAGCGGFSCARPERHADRHQGGLSGLGSVLPAGLCQGLRSLSLLVPAVPLTM